MKMAPSPPSGVAAVGTVVGPAAISVKVVEISDSERERLLRGFNEWLGGISSDVRQGIGIVGPEPLMPHGLWVKDAGIETPPPSLKAKKEWMTLVGAPPTPGLTKSPLIGMKEVQKLMYMPSDEEEPESLDDDHDYNYNGTPEEQAKKAADLIHGMKKPKNAPGTTPQAQVDNLLDPVTMMKLKATAEKLKASIDKAKDEAKQAPQAPFLTMPDNGSAWPMSFGGVPLSKCEVLHVNIGGAAYTMRDMSGDWKAIASSYGIELLAVGRIVPSFADLIHDNPNAWMVSGVQGNAPQTKHGFSIVGYCNKARAFLLARPLKLTGWTDKASVLDAAIGAASNVFGDFVLDIEWWVPQAEQSK